MPPNDNPFAPPCWSCGCEVTSYRRGCVPWGIDCCQRCWNRVPVFERLKLAISMRDREPGGFLSELAELVMRSVERGPHSTGLDGDDDDFK